MDITCFDDALILTGPTASGKTAVGLVLAEQLQAEIISLDSMAVYRGMDIGTAKPTLAERQRVPHHLVDVLDPWESASVAWWLEQAIACCRAIQARGRRVLVVGGTPLYLKALLRGLFDGPPADPTLRRQLEQEPGEALHAKLRAVDPLAASRLHPNDIRRLVRALEVHALTGRPISAWQEQFDTVRPRRFAPVWLDLPRAELYARIDARVEAMFAQGLVEEVRALTQLPRPLSKEARQALGYREVLDHLAGRTDRDTTLSLVQTHSRQFAKRQLTWFRHLAECQALSIAEDMAEVIAERVRAVWGGVKQVFDRHGNPFGTAGGCPV